ncbi:sulfur oxidation c-type cytochrome SoxA [Thauera humireducens]|jgi:sulfur-oxidizing protein SoxA|uniref:L-cysteine S-thiosulfotransferase subunit SoxA n=1 Tax=Thauera humireducens TaxID=1134435 RepID=A0A140IDX5_9RHOO|nr:sulfur oxidation c-type cytochrome SoxA [Thauera humireducens]AMO35950.1 hypothetical protein AC731_002730 [Thauera humireducens]
MQKLTLLAARTGLVAALWATTSIAVAQPTSAGQAPSVQHDYWPGRDKAVPHVSGDGRYSDTYENWKDAAAIAAARAAGKQSHEINFKDFRWLTKSLDAELVIDEGREVFHRKNADGQSCASCHGDNGEKLKGVYARLPKFNTRLGRVVVGPTQIEACATERLGQQDWRVDTRANSVLDMYVASLSDGAVVDVDVASEGPLKAAYLKGRDLFFKRTGQFHYACASCHTPPSVGNYLRGQRPTTFFGDAAQYPIYHFPYALPGDDLAHVFTLQHQIRSCQQLSRMHQGKEGSPSMTAIEVFLKASANGYPMSIPTQQYNLDTDYLEQ